VRNILVSTLAVAILSLCFAYANATDTLSEETDSRVVQGFEISPIPKAQLNFKKKNHDRVGLGSYLVNGPSGCGGCHSFPAFLADGDPFTGPPQSVEPIPVSAHFNTAHYLAGGQCFGPFMAVDITPDKNGLPDHLTLKDFITALRTGVDVACNNDPADPICAIGPPIPLLQVMPWPAYHNMTDQDLTAIYYYLAALPHADPCNTPADGCPGFSGLALHSTTYVYPNTADCPNPAPPQ
jgi:hypothetical protein